MPDEYAAFGTQSDGSTGITHYAGEKIKTTNVEGTTDEEQFDNNMLAMYKEANTPDNTWHQATVSDRAFVIGSFKDLWKSIKSIITSKTTLIRDSRQPDRYYFTNDLVRMNEDTFLYHIKNRMDKNLLIDMDGVRFETIQHLSRLREKLKNLKMDAYINKQSLIKKDINEIDFMQADKVEQQFTTMYMNDPLKYEVIDNELIGNEIPEQAFSQLTEPEKQMEQVFITLNPIQDIPQQQFTELMEELELPEQEFISMILNLDKPEQEFIKMNTVINEVKQEFTELIKNLDKPELEFTELIMNLEHRVMVLTELIKNLSKYKQDFIQMDLETELPELAMTELIKNLKTPDMIFTFLEKNLDKPELEFAQMILRLDKAVLEMTELIQNLKKPEQIMTNLLEPE